MELKTTITVNKEVAEALKNLYNQVKDMNWDFDIFALLCFAIANDETQVYFDYDETIINIHYEEVEE